MNKPIELTLEQQFNLRAFQTTVSQMSREKAQFFLVKLYEQMMIRETLYKRIIKPQSPGCWGLD